MNTIYRTFAAAFLVLLLGFTACEKAPAEPMEEPLATRPDKADPNDWCAGHDVPESMCTKCHKELISRYQAAGDYCEAHKFPESVCPKCNPLAVPAGAPTTDEHHDEH